MATVLDLARKGYFKIQEEAPEEGFLADDKPTFSIKRTDQQSGDNLCWSDCSAELICHFYGS